MSNSNPTFDEALRDVRTLKDLCQHFPGDFEDDFAGKELLDLCSRAEIRFAEVEPENAAQALLQLSYLSERFEDGWITAIDRDAVIARAHAIAEREIEARRKTAEAVSPAKVKHPLDGVWSQLIEAYGDASTDAEREAAAAGLLALPARHIEDCIIKLDAAGICAATARAGGSFSDIVNELIDTVEARRFGKWGQGASQ